MRAVKHAPLVAVHIAIYALLWWSLSGVFTVQAAGFAVLLIWISCRDIAIFEIPDVAAGLLVVSGLLFGPDMAWSVAGAVVWGGLFWCVHHLAARRLGDGALGLGDVKLMAGIGAWLGPVAPTYVTMCAAFAAIATLFAVTLLRREKIADLAGTGIAFGPFLCLSAWAIWAGGLA